MGYFISSDLGTVSRARGSRPSNLQTGSRTAKSGLRFYNPAIGRWLNRDPIGNLHSAYLYGFIDNSPTRFVDFLGLEKAKAPCCEQSKIDEVGEDMATRARALTMADKPRYREYCGIICCNPKTGSVTPSGPHAGKDYIGAHHLPGYPWDERVKPSCEPNTLYEWVAGMEWRKISVQCDEKKGEIQVGIYHSHPDGWGQTPSGDDWGILPNPSPPCRGYGYIGHGKGVCRYWKEDGNREIIQFSLNAE